LTIFINFGFNLIIQILRNIHIEPFDIFNGRFGIYLPPFFNLLIKLLQGFFLPDCGICIDASLKYIGFEPLFYANLVFGCFQLSNIVTGLKLHSILIWW
jgi:hypothetical protein